MTTRRNAILLFSKLPEAGKVKTRLTPIKDGRFAPEIASVLYHCMFFDVIEICCDACKDMEAASGQGDMWDEYDIIISTPAGYGDAMRELLGEAGTWPRPLTVIEDAGRSFDEHYNHAFDQVWEMGYDTLLSMGCDMPALRRNIVTTGFHYLHWLCDVEGGGIVLAPDQEMGVSVVGWTSNTDFNHDGVFYNKTGLTVLPAYIQKASQLGLPACYLPDVPDVDTMADLRHNVTLVQALEYCAQFQGDVTAPWRTADCLRQMGYTDVRVMPNELRDDRSEIDADLARRE